MLALRHVDTTDPLLVMKVYLIASGIYIWEYFTNLDYEWSVIRGRQRYRWTIWIYTIARFSTLNAVALNLANFSITTQINCHAWILFGWIVSTLGCYGLGSMLIVLRIFAIWDKNKIVMAISLTVWLTNVAFQCSAIPNVNSTWVPSVRACVNDSIKPVKNLGTAALACDVTLLLIMLAGLLRHRHRDRGFVNIASFLWRQGVIWLFIATTAQLPQVILLYVDSNETFDSVFLFPSLIMLMIASTRMYRDLTFYSSTPPNSSGPDTSKLSNSNRFSTKGSAAIVHIPSNRLEVTVHKAYEEYPMSHMDRYDSHPSSDAQLTDKTVTPVELCLDDNVEGQDEKV